MERPRPDPEALLAHEAFLRRIARPLVRDDAGVDDVVQETWLTALRKAPRDASRLRQWLGAIARNLALRARRAEERRARREQQAARPEGDDVVARVARHQRIVDAVLTLEEPYRTAVLLRFYDGLSSDEIGARSGVSGAAVRKRLAKALELLRGTLDDLHGGDRRAWSAVLLPFMVVPRPGPAALVGGIVMGTKAKLGLSAVLLLALLGTLWSVSRRPDAPARADSAAAPSSDDVPSPVPPDPLPSPVDFALIDRDRDVHGVVVRRDGTPVASADVQAVYFPWRRVLHTNHHQRFGESEGPRARAATDGTFALRLDWGDLVQLRATAPGFATADVPLVQAGERVRIVLAPPARLAVLVRDQTGQPLADARVQLVLGEEGRGGPGIDLILDRRRFEAATGADGRVAWEELPDEGRASLYVQHRTHASAHRYLDLGAEREVEVALDPGFAVRGRVLDAATMQGVAGAVVGTLGEGPKATTTGADGRYSLEGLESITLKATAPGYVDAGVSVGAGWHAQRWPERRVENRDEIDFHLVRAEVVTGRIVDPKGVPIAGALLSVGSPAILSISGESGPDGRFRFEGPWSARVPTGAERGDMVAPADGASAQHHIQVLAKGHGRTRVFFDARRLDLGDIVLPKPGAIEGRVLTPEGVPVPGAPVLLQHGMMESRRTDDLGRFRFRDLEPGSYRLSTQPDGAPWLETAIELPEGGRVVLDLRYESWRRLTVHVRTEDGRPIEGALARVATGFRMAEARTGADGDATVTMTGTPRFAIADPPKLAGDLRFRQPILTQLEGHETEVTIVLVLEGIVRGRVESPEGTPVTMARLEVHQGGKKVGYGGTGEDGLFEIQVPREGAFDILLTGRNGSENETRILRGELLGVRAGATGLVLKARAIEATRTLLVRVLAPDGTPTDAPVFASPTARPFYVSTQGGIAEIKGLPDEEVTVRAGRPSEWSWAPPAPVRVVPRGQEVTLRFRKAGTVEGRVLLPDGSPATRTYIHAYAGKEELAAVTTEEDGTFRLAFEPDVEGPIRLEARRDLPSDREHTAVLDGVAPGATGVDLRLSAAR